MVRWATGTPYVRTRSGRKFLLDPHNPDLWKQWHVPDIAFHAAGINRFTGGSRISVAQHMVVGARMAEKFYPGQKMLPAKFMIHDVAETVLNDIASPLKSLLPDYKELEALYDVSVEKFADLGFLDDPLVKEVDNRMWLTEREMVYMHVDDDISEDTVRVPLEPFDLMMSEFIEEFSPWDPSFAEEQYLVEFRRLLPWVDW